MFSHPTCVRFSPTGMDALNITLGGCHKEMLELQTWLFTEEKGAQEKGARQTSSTAPFSSENNNVDTSGPAFDVARLSSLSASSTPPITGEHPDVDHLAT